MSNWLLQTLSDVLNDCENQKDDSAKVLSENHSTAELKAQREWFGAIAAAENLLESTLDSNDSNKDTQGLVFSSLPVFNNTALISRLQTGIFTPEAFQFKALMPSGEESKCNRTKLLDRSSLGQLPLIPNDPIAKERFCLILTKAFALVLVLGTDEAGTPQFHFSFAPETIERVWQTLRSRLVLLNYQDLPRLESSIGTYQPQNPDYRLVSRFSRHLLQNLPDLTNLALEPTRNIDVAASDSHYKTVEVRNTSSNNGELEWELLQALTHEVRTPLTTIRTLTKLLLKKKQELQPRVVQRLQAIDRECTEQIERMELIFRAAELKATPVSQESVHLTPCCLESLLEETIPRWEEQAQRRKVNLDVSVPQHLPEVVSDPAMLDRVLTGLMESCTRSLSTGDKIRVHVSTAGDRLKLRVISQSDNSKNPFKSLGHLLMFQPGTGCLSLNWDITKQMFQAMGGKLTVRQRARQEKELTIFLPLGKKVNNTR